MSEKSHPLSFRLPEATKKALEKAAQADHRSVSSLIEKLLTDWLAANKFLKK